MTIALVACNNSSDGTTTNDSSNVTSDTPTVAPGGVIADSSNTSIGDTSHNTSDTTK